jgi:hypothetical protein
LGNPAFKKLYEAKLKIENMAYLSIPIFDHEGEFVSTLQVESKYILIGTSTEGKKKPKK